jgi:hypothetical protein
MRLFRSALSGNPGAFSVIYLHGPGGIGKSTLLQRMADEAQDVGRTVVHIDGRTAGSRHQFEAEAAPALTDQRAVITVDGFERCQNWEGWLCDQFLPRILVGVVVVIASRQPPDPRVWSDPGWSEALRVVALRDLSRAESVALLREHAVAPAMYRSLLANVGGHPLALRLAADAVTGSPATTEGWTLTRDVTETLLSHLVGRVPSQQHRRVLEACALLMTTTQDLLRAVLPEPDTAPEMFAWLRSLPLIEPVKHGLRPHALIRDLLDRDFRWRDPQGYLEMQSRVRATLVERARRATDAEVLPTIAALNFLHRRHALPGYVGRQGDAGLIHGPLQPDDIPEVLRLATLAEGEQTAEIVRFWLGRRPEDFHVFRTPDGGPVIAFMTWLKLQFPDPQEGAVDPVVEAAWTHARAAGPLRAGEHLGIARFGVTLAAYQPPSKVSELFGLMITAEWLHDDRMAWSFMVFDDPNFWGPLMHYLDQFPARETARVGDRTYTLFAHDWRAVPVDAWLEHNGKMLQSGPQPLPSSTDPARAGLVVLSRPEFDLAVRDALRDWGRPSQLSSNPLTFGRLIADRDQANPTRALRDVIADAVAELGTDPRHAKVHQALNVTFIRGALTQQAAANQLGLPFSTYRRHLTAGITLICDRLWEQELRGGKS